MYRNTFSIRKFYNNMTRLDWAGPVTLGCTAMFHHHGDFGPHGDFHHNGDVGPNGDFGASQTYGCMSSETDVDNAKYVRVKITTTSS